MPKSSFELCPALTLLFTLQAASLLFRMTHSLPQKQSLKRFFILSNFFSPLLHPSAIFHTLGLAPPAPSLQTCFFQVPAPIAGSSGRCSGGVLDTVWQRCLRQGHETWALTRELNKPSFSGMMHLLVYTELKGTSTPCSRSRRNPTLWNKLQLQTKPREEEWVQLSRRLNP